MANGKGEDEEGGKRQGSRFLSEKDSKRRKAGSKESALHAGMTDAVRWRFPSTKKEYGPNYRE